MFSYWVDLTSRDVPVAVVGEHGHYIPATADSGDERIAVGHHDRVNLAGRERLRRRAVFEPQEFGVNASLFDRAFLNGDFPGEPARPVAIGYPDSILSRLQHRAHAFPRRTSAGKGETEDRGNHLSIAQLPTIPRRERRVDRHIQNAPAVRVRGGAKTLGGKRAAQLPG